MMLNYRHKLGGICLAAACLSMHLAVLPAQATSVNTVPNGYFTLTIPAGFGTSSSISVLSFPVQGVTTGLTGQTSGVITAVATTGGATPTVTITNSNAGWTAGTIAGPSLAATPYLLQITSGTATGRTFLLSTTANNTATSVTLDGNDAIKTPDLAAIGVVAGTDTYQITPADTLSTIFGTPASTGIVGGAGTATNADLITVYTTGWNSYYYDTSANQWQRVANPHLPGNNIVIRPDSGVIFNRYGTQPLSLVVTGQVPSVPRKSLVANSGVTLLGSNWPVDQTLGNSNIQNLPGWVSGSSAATADTLVIFDPSTGWHTYYYNGTNWMLTVPPKPSNNVVFSAGSIGYINKLGATQGYSVLTQPIPYSL